MVNDDTLRAQLTQALAFQLRGSALEKSVAPLADAVMPTIRAHLADAWDDGYRTHRPHTTDAHLAVHNPWRQA